MGARRTLFRRQVPYPPPPNLYFRGSHPAVRALVDICQLRASLFAQILYSHQGREIVSDYLDHLPDALCKSSCLDRACTNALKNVDAKGNMFLDLSGPLMLVPCSPHESVEFLGPLHHVSSDISGTILHHAALGAHTVIRPHIPGSNMQDT